MEKYQIPGKNSQIAAVVAFILLVATEFAYRDPLYDASEQVIKDLQQSSGKGFFQVVTTIGDGTIYVVAIIGCGAYYSRGTTLHHISFFVIYDWLLAITKVAYHEGRPYLSFPDSVTAEDCEAGWGNPSGHSWGSSSFTTLLFLAVVFPASKNVMIPYEE